VGIGTDSPDGKLHVEGTSRTFAKIKTTAEAGAQIIMENAAHAYSILTSTSGGVGTADKFVVNDDINGKARLTIEPSGDAKFSGTVTCAGGGKLQVGDEKTYLSKGTINSANGTALGSNNGFILLNNSFDKFMPSVSGQVDLGSSGQLFKDAHFSGTVNS